MSSDREYKTVFGSRIQWAMQQAGVSVEDVAEHYDVTVQTVYRWLRDDPRVNIDRLEQLADYLGKPTWWFFAPEDAIEKPDPEERRRAIIERLKALPGGGSIDPSEVPTVEAAKILAGFFYFGERRIRTSIVFNAEGPPGNLGGHSPD